MRASKNRLSLDLLRRYNPNNSEEDESSRLKRPPGLPRNGNPVLQDTLGQKYGSIAPMKKPKTLYSLFPNISSYKSLITDTVSFNKAVAVVGQHLQAKSLAIPQFLLEQSSLLQTEVLILVCKYDEMLAVEAAHQLADQRGEKVGETVGYKVTNECSISSSTCLIFCSPNVLLHTLAARNSNLIQGTPVDPAPVLQFKQFFVCRIDPLDIG